MHVDYTPVGAGNRAPNYCQATKLVAASTCLRHLDRFIFVSEGLRTRKSPERMKSGGPSSLRACLERRNSLCSTNYTRRWDLFFPTKLF
ncbi:hypothetical protein PAHAL_6G042000 [Panicum hallii]|uniref:Uncharacterized protein n=1 Tax=Panicum hallii TaxID=206008 RepID=A0A2T8IF48_9POAL|nr:hypothetical protein PAHAL_6G042000 [Panicum hallii]